MPNNKTIDLSIIMTAHHEGRLMQSSLRSLSDAIRKATRRGYQIELIVTLDRPDIQTQEYVENYLPALINEVPVKVLKVDFGDVSGSRNYAIQHAKGFYTGVIDGDDVYGGELMVEAIAALQNHPGAIVHPEYVISFDSYSEIWHLVSSSDVPMPTEALVEVNPWPSVAFAETSVFKSVPYTPSSALCSFGPEDWHWNLETLGLGYSHEIAKGSVYFYRRKASGSLAQQHGNNHTLLSKSLLLGLNHPKVLTPSLEEYVHRAEAILPKKVLRRAVLKATRRALRLADRVVHPLFAAHGRLRHFEMQFGNALYELLQPPRRPPDVVQYEPFPAWLIAEWKRVQSYDHKLYPTDEVLAQPVYYIPRPGLYMQEYWKLAQQIGAEVDYLFIVPWLKRGGADLVIINYVNAITNLRPEARVVVLGTELSDSPWSHHLPDGVEFITLDESFYHLAGNEQTRLLASLIVQLNIRHVHLCNSAIGYRMLTEYAQPLSTISKLFVSCFCFDYLYNGEMAVHYSLDHLKYSIDYLERVFTDNIKVIDDLANLQALPRDKFSVHYQPMEYDNKVSDAHVPKRFTKKSPLRILWAGRIDTQKRPDILIDIADRIIQEKLPVEINIYGTSLLSDDRYMEMIQSHEGIVYHGGYDNGILGLPLDRFNVFMMTSQWEGMPNAPLEATAGGLPVIAPAVGGIPEFVSDKTGFLIAEYDNIDQYLEVLRLIISAPELLDQSYQRAHRLLKSRHSRDSFHKVLLKENNYL